MKVRITIEIDGNELQRDFVWSDEYPGDTFALGEHVKDMICSLERYNKETPTF